jgi:singapore isolate B (sub-type 7) whole genome shotgun sequence assembly, scaffold_0
MYRDRLREILGLDPTTIVEYKLHKQSLVDGSTFRNAQAYVFAAKPEESTASEEKKESA